MPHIFISYRRQDSAEITGRIHDRLVRKFGAHRVFRDVYDIPAGRDFRAVLNEEVGRCDIFLAIIGPQWVRISDDEGKRRLEQPDDFVRIEVESALNNPKTLVIPVLVDRASMPVEGDLPESLGELCYRNAVQVRTDPDFPHDMDSLIRQIKRSTSSIDVQRIWPAIALASVLVAGIFLFPKVYGAFQKPDFFPTATEPAPTATLPVFVTASIATPSTDRISIPPTGLKLENVVKYETTWEYNEIDLGPTNDTPREYGLAGLVLELPADVDPETDPEGTLSKVIETFSSTELMDLDWPTISPGLELKMDLYNIQSAGGIETKIENEAKSRITSYGPARSQVNALLLYVFGHIYVTSGGGGFNYPYAPMRFDPREWKSREFSTTLDQYDYISLEPGKFEGVEFPLGCNEPGIYTLKVTVNVGYLGDMAGLGIDSPELNCPDSFDLWSVQLQDGFNPLWYVDAQDFDSTSLELLHVGEFVFEDGKYVPAP